MINVLARLDKFTDNTLTKIWLIIEAKKIIIKNNTSLTFET